MESVYFFTEKEIKNHLKTQESLIEKKDYVSLKEFWDDKRNRFKLIAFERGYYS